jgi:pimeloyl-ACP methyl ester carboxylesterase
VRRAILIGHSWGGAFATAYALAFPQRTAGLVLLAAVTHPWPADPGWYNKIAGLPCVGTLFLRTCVYPLGLLLTTRATRGVFEPQSVPEDYVRRSAIRLVLRPKTFYCNTRDPCAAQGFHYRASPALCKSSHANHYHYRRPRHNGVTGHQRARPRGYVAMRQTCSAQGHWAYASPRRSRSRSHRDRRAGTTRQNSLAQSQIDWKLGPRGMNESYR